jgi:hypothetical protein
MNLLRKKIARLPLGIWIVLMALLLICLAWIMQAYSLYNWESAVRHGLQNGSFSGDATDKLWAQKEKGEAIADLVWPLPLTIIALFGILKKRFFGFIAGMMTFAICIYFPLFYLFQLWDSYRETALAAVLLWGFPSAFGMIGLWANRQIYTLDLRTQAQKNIGL